MKLKTYAAVVTAALAMVVTPLVLWAGTRLPLQDVIAFALAAYYVGLVGAFAVIERMEKHHQRCLAAKIVTLVQAEMDRRKEEAS